MELINHTINWCKGEIFEGKMSLLFGIVVLIVSLAYWKFGSTPYAKAMFLPLLVVAAFTLFTGYYLVSANNKRIQEYTQQFNENPTKFVEDEKVRTDAFIKWYPYTRYIISVIAIIGMALAQFTLSPIWRSIGLSLILLVLYVFFLDHFSEERALEYHQHILKQLS